MTDLTKISVTATAESALKKLKKANIGVYGCKKEGARFIFHVKDKHIKKAFAIFAKPCYNISVEYKSTRTRFLTRAVNRIGLVIGAFIFVVIAVLSNSFVFKITVSGSGSYLSPEVRRIIYESGVKEFKIYSGFDAPMATGKILALPQVTFCNIEKHGSILHVDVQVDEEHNRTASRTPLVSDRAGKVKNLVVICGTAAVSIGAEVKEGDKLIEPYTTAGDKQVDSIAVGYAELECTQTFEYYAAVESDESLKNAYAAVLLQAEEILTRKHTVYPAKDGVIYVIEFTFLHKLSINME